MTDYAAKTEAVRARAQLGLGQREEAVRTVAQAKALLAQSKAPGARSAVASAEALIAAAVESSGLDEARRKVEQTLAEARDNGMVENQLDLRLVVAVLELPRDTGAAKKHLKALANDARERGFSLVAGKAEAFLKQPERKARF